MFKGRTGKIPMELLRVLRWLGMRVCVCVYIYIYSMNIWDIYEMCVYIYGVCVCIYMVYAYICGINKQ